MIKFLYTCNVKLQPTSHEANKIIEQQRDAILNLIDTKIETDMKEVIAKIESQNQKFDMQTQSLKNEIKIVYWVIGIAMTILLAIIALKK